MHRLKIHQIVRMREIFRKWRHFAGKSRSLSGDSSSAAGGHPRVPPGHLAVYVGPERERFVIKTSLLAHPLFKALLKKTEAEVGFHYAGGLTIPCSISAFRSLLQLMQGKGSLHESLPTTTTGLHIHLVSHDQLDDMDVGNQEELQLLLHELHCLYMRDTSSHSASRCAPEPRLSLLFDAGLQEPIFG